MNDRTFLGLDLSTQQLKAAVCNDVLEIIHEEAVNFEIDLPEFRTQGGVIIDKANSKNVSAPVLMWIKALDILMDRLIVAGVDFTKIAAVSGTAQQHGSVYWQKGANYTLDKLNPNNFLHQQLAHSFSVVNSPVWMDASTTKQCKQLEDAIGGATYKINGSTMSYQC
ncbi:hypothetical protein JTB14_021444 [Gonioctena quinquepunctata]|nr:hypothetical protein JTB14_021444 [Gonioctena quinquepunctata]